MADVKWRDGTADQFIKIKIALKDAGVRQVALRDGWALVLGDAEDVDNLIAIWKYDMRMFRNTVRIRVQ